MKLIRYTLICLIGLFCLLYSIFGADFAEINFQLPFLDFPIFIGEILLSLCFFILLPYSIRKKDNFKYFFIFLICFIMIKALFGYLRYGPLALRNAALFYYLLFIYIGYLIFSVDFFKHKIVSYGIIVTIVTVLIFNSLLYFGLTYIILITVLFLKNKIKFKWFLYIPVISLAFFHSRLLSRSVFGAIFFTTIFLLFTIPFLPNFRTRKIFFIVVSIFLVIWVCAFFCLGQKDKRFKGLFSPTQILSTYNLWNEYIKNSTEVIKDSKYRTILYEHRSNPIFVKDLGQNKKRFTELTSEKIKVKKIKIIEAGELKVAEPKKLKVAKIDNLPEKKEISKEKIVTPEVGNMLWRVVAWRDMCREIISQKPILGFDFGYPFRPKSFPKLGWTGITEKGWIEPHNSFLHIIYRAGIFGVFIIIYIIYLTIKISITFVKRNNFVGILLVINIIFWFCISNFLVIMELPYYAIPLWSFFGMVLAYAQKQ